MGEKGSHKENALTALDQVLKEIDAWPPSMEAKVMTARIEFVRDEVAGIEELKRRRGSKKKAPTEA